MKDPLSPALHKFPRTPHLFWLGRSEIRDDKLLSSTEATEFLSHEIVVEEKVDGANLGISLSPSGDLQVQNRGNFLTTPTGQFSPLKSWLAPYALELTRGLRPGTVLFGEWCYARHSTAYSALPDWFLGIDVFDANTSNFYDVVARNERLTNLGITPVTQIARGRFTRSDLVGFLNSPSNYGDAPLEGIYLRWESDGELVRRAKLVRPEFLSGIREHWSKKPIIPNTKK